MNHPVKNQMTKDQINTLIGEKAPFLTLSQNKHGFWLGMKGDPFFSFDSSKSYNVLLGNKLSVLTEDDVMAAIEKATPSVEALIKQEMTIRAVYDMDVKRVDSYRKDENWAQVAEYANILTTNKASLLSIKQALRALGETA